MGPLNGMSETISAAEAPVMPWMSPSFVRVGGDDRWR